MIRQPSEILEVAHGGEFVRYHLRYAPSGERPEWPLYRKLEPIGVYKLSSDEATVYEDLYQSIEDNKLTRVGMDIYYSRIKPYYRSWDGTVNVEVNDTQDNLFNIPVNLLLAAATITARNITYSTVNGVIVRLVRHQDSVEVIDNVRDIRYLVELYNDSPTFNELSPRSIQYEHLAHLIRCSTFVNEITNGNLTLAYADIFQGNLDDDVIDCRTHTDHNEYIHYDQFTGVVSDNTIEVMCDTSRPSMYVGDYQANELNSGLVELLGISAAAICKIPNR